VSTSYSPQEFAMKVRAIIAALDAALVRGVAKATNAVLESAQANLDGHPDAAPWAYPVPKRTGALASAMQARAETPLSGLVFNDKDYAWAIHSGVMPQWAGRGKHRVTQRLARPFMDDAVESAKPLMVIQTEVEGALQAWA
jgi:hypothetical protein